MAAKTHKLGPGSLKFGATGSEQEFAVGCRQVAVEPETEEGDMVPVLSGDEYSEGDEDSYTLTGEILQTYEASSFILWAHENHGTEVPFVFVPDNDKDFGVTGTVKVRRVTIGGEVKERNTSEFEWAGVGDYKLVNPTDDTELAYTPAVPVPEVGTDDSPEWD